MNLLFRNKYITALSFVIIMSLVNVAVSFAQTSIDDPVSGTTLNSTQYELFTYDIEVSGGQEPYVYDISTLPSGYSLEVDDDTNDAQIVGVASSAGTFGITLNVADTSEPPDNTEDTVTFDIVVAATTNDLIINVPDVYEVTDGQVNVSYTTLQFSTTDDTNEARFEWGVSDNNDLPDGMIVNIDGELIGFPTESGEFDFTVTVEDPDTGDTGTRDYKITITGGTTTSDLEIVSPSGSSLRSGVLNRSYIQDVDAAGGTGSYAYSASGLPSGLVIDTSTGLITGTPSVFGTFNVRITVDDGDDNVSRDYTLTISETGNAEYESIPSPGVTIDFGNVNIGGTLTLNIIVSEDGTDQLDVSQPSGGLIQGVDANNFSIVSNSPPFSISDGGNDVIVQVRCTPDEAGDYNAILQFITNDTDIPTAVYSLFCTGVVSGGAEDVDDTTTDGTTDTVSATNTPSIPTQTPLPPTYGNVIEVEGLSLRTGPFIGASRRDVLRRDTVYRILAKNNQEGVYMWYQIQLDDGRIGWASGRYLAVYGQDVPFAGSQFDNVFTERDRGVRVQALDNLNFRPAPSDRTTAYPDLIPWGAQLTLYAKTTSGRGDEWYAVEYNGVFGWVYAPNTKLVEGLMDAVPKY